MANRRGSGSFDGGRSSSAASSSGGAAAAGSHVAFCINPVLFENCGMLLESPSGLTTASVMKLREESSNTTSVSLASWKDLAVNVLGLREVTAYSIFDVFFALSGGCMQGTASYALSSEDALGGKSVAELRQESSRMLLSKMGGSVDEARWPVASTARQVSLPGLIVFLLAQLVLERCSPKQPLGEVSPESIINSVRQYLHDYITATAVTRQGRVSLADALELRILLREFVNGTEQPFGTSLGFLWPRSERTIDIAILSQFIRPRIVQASELLANSGGSAKAQQAQLQKLLANNTVLRGIHDRVVTPPMPATNDPQTLKLLSSNYTIADCTQSAFYVAAAMPPTRLSQLSNCTVALGPVAGVLCVDRCQNCTISAICGAIVVSNSTNVQLFVCTNTPPVLLQSKTASGGSSASNGVGSSAAASLVNVRFGPYNSHYSALEEHLAISGISPKLNLWNAGLPSQSFLIPPESFTPISFPVNPPINAAMTTRTNPCPLPQPYEEALTRRLQRFEEISGSLHSAYTRLEDEGRHDLAENLRASVNTMFMEWLQQNGQAAGLSELLRGNTAAGTSAR